MAQELTLKTDRWHALRNGADPGDIPALARLFREAWIDSEIIWRERKQIRSLIKNIGEENRRHLFTDEDWRQFQDMPNRITVYRGAKSWNVSGMSWTCDIDRAAYFATHHDDGFAGSLSPRDYGHVYEKTISKDSILFYTNERNESEVITRRFVRGRISPVGQIHIALLLGPQEAIDEFGRKKNRLDPKTLAEYSTYAASWRAAC